MILIPVIFILIWSFLNYVELKKGQLNRKTISLAMTVTLLTLIVLFIIIQILTDNLLTILFDFLQFGLGPRVIIQPILWIILMIFIPKLTLNKINEFAIRYDRSKFNE